MTNYNERLDELLANLVNQVAANEQRLLNGNATRKATIDSDSNATMRAEQSLRTLFQEAMDEVIADVGYSKTVNNYVALQRQRAKALLDEMFNAPR